MNERRKKKRDRLGDNMSLREKIFGTGIGIGMTKDDKVVQNVAEDLKASPNEFIMMLGGMLDSMIKTVSLTQYKEMKAKNPKAQIVPILEANEIQHDETKLFLEFVNTLGDSIPKEVRKGVFKVAMGLAYKIDTDSEFRKKFDGYMDKIVAFRVEAKAKDLSKGIELELAKDDKT